MSKKSSGLSPWTERYISFWNHPTWLKIVTWIPVPIFLFFGGERYVEEDHLRAGLYVFPGLVYLIFLTKAVNQTRWVTVGMRVSVAVSLFIAGMYREMGDLPFAIGFGVGGLLVYSWLFRPDWSVVGIDLAKNASEAKDNSTTEESEPPD